MPFTIDSSERSVHKTKKKALIEEKLNPVHCAYESDRERRREGGRVNDTKHQRQLRSTAKTKATTRTTGQRSEKGEGKKKTISKSHAYAHKHAHTWVLITGRRPPQ